MASWLDSVGSFFTGNKGWLEPVVNLGLGAYQTATQNQSRDDLSSMLRERERANYDQQKANYDAYVNWAQGAYGANQAASASRAAAAQRTEAARQQAMKKGMKAQGKKYDEAMGYMQPWRESATRLLPQAEATYSNSLGGINGLQALLQSPAFMNRMSASTPAYAVNLGLPDYLKGA